MKIYSIGYNRSNLKNIETYKNLIDFAWEKSDCFSLSKHKEDAIEKEIINSSNLIKTEECGNMEAYIRYFFNLNQPTKKWLKDKKGMFDFSCLQDLIFYKNEEAWFYSSTHDQVFGMTVTEKDLKVLDDIDPNYSIGKKIGDTEYGGDLPINKEKEEKFVKTFVDKQEQKRILMDLFSKKQRGYAILRFARDWESLLRLKYTHFINNEKNIDAIEKEIYALTNSNDNCYIMGTLFDCETMSLRKALEVSRDWSFPSIILVSDNVAYIKTERIWDLQKKGWANEGGVICYYPKT